MSNAETVYTVGVSYPDYLQRGRPQIVALPLYVNETLSAPTTSGSTFALFDPGGAAIIPAAGVTVTGSIATYPILGPSLPSTLPLGHSYYEEWYLICADGVPRTYRRDAAVVRYAPYPVVTDADILEVYSGLDRQLKAGTTSFVKYRMAAWKRIIRRLETTGVFPDQVITQWSAYESQLELTLHLICLDLHTAQGGKWKEIADGHKKEFELAFGRMKIEKATGDSGAADSDALQAPDKGVTFMNASPAATWAGSWGL